MKIIKGNGALIFVSLISILYLYLSCNFIINLDEFNLLKLNEKGDFLAGVFSPLAFLWLVYGYLQQGRELKQNTESLRIQAIELRNSVEEQKKLIKIHEDDQKVQHEQAKPIFEFENLRFDPEKVEMVEDNPFTREPRYQHKQQDISFHLKNLGSPIKKIKIFRNENLIESITLLEKGAKEFIVIYLTDEEQNSLHTNAVLELQFKLSYLDMLGLEHVEFYRIVLNDRFEDDDGMAYYKCDLRRIKAF
ncbi:TPA: hypothetical protein MW179_000519 [Acinetobacter baumannii]|uniref:hypothetical protein n=1 Tax=Acinetobacter pittii TaxID=48296 RepID=UPI0024DED046|nr:hypothetical protein [Acinetobacter pittii]HCC8380807.1 hypothetical protein [Acinetobacter baumannii]